MISGTPEVRSVMETTVNLVLPSLNALRAFEATARCRSMTLAAQELCVTHGAVSRQIKSLEAALGVTLLTRGVRSSEPTPEGMRLAEGLTAASGLMYATVEHVKPGPLVLSCSSSIAMCWLIPRMSGFYQQNPRIEIQLDMNYDRVDFVRHNISVAIRNSTIEPPRNALIRDLGTEWIGPVCSSEYFAAANWEEPANLAQALLLSTKTRPNAWADWLAASETERVDLKPQRSFEHFYLMIQAAAFGLGVAVVPHMLAINDLKSGRLIAPFGFVPGPRQLFLWIAPHLGSRKEVKALEGWLMREMQDHVPSRAPRP
jgi:LysR family transcriptional regulator, glycine cleavage system transcriptional activator